MKGYWIRPDKTFLGKNTSYRFEKTVNVSENADIELNISADTRYKCYFNGEYLCERVRRELLYTFFQTGRR